MAYSVRDMRETETFTIDSDHLWPRDRLHRFRLYVRSPEGLAILNAAPTMGGIGSAILAQHEAQKADGLTLGDLGQIGVLDTCPDGEPSETGEWIVNPFTKV